MRPLTATTPKPLLRVAGTPILTRCFEQLADAGVDDIVVVVGYLADQIIERYGTSFNGISLSYTVQPTRRGLADALLTAEPLVSEDFIVLNGDNVFTANLPEAVRRHEATEAAATLIVESLPREQASQTGVFVLDADDRPVGMVEKPTDPPSTLAATGLFVFSPMIFHACHLVRPSARGETELTAAIDLLLYADRDVETIPLRGWRANLNTPGDLAAAEQRLAE